MEIERDGFSLLVTLVKPGSVDTPYMEYARSYVRAAGTKNPPRAYAPEVVARGIAWTCENHIRDLDVGGAGWLTTKSGRVAPRLTDFGMEAFGRLLQTSNRPPRSGMRDNFHDTARAGEVRSDQPGPPPRGVSLMMEAQMRPAAALGIAGIVLAVGIRATRARRTDR